MPNEILVKTENDKTLFAYPSDSVPRTGEYISLQVKADNLKTFKVLDVVHCVRPHSGTRGLTASRIEVFVDDES